MRVAFAALLVAASLTAYAQSTERARPAGTIPLNDAPPPPPIGEVDAALEPQVTTRTEGDNTVQEYRIRGRLYMQRVTPRHGKAYVLTDHRGDGTFTRQDNTLDNGVRVPQWVLAEF